MKKEWRSGTVLRILTQYVDIKGNVKCRCVRVAYDDISLKPKSTFAKIMMEWTDPNPEGENRTISDEAHITSQESDNQSPNYEEAQISIINPGDSEYNGLWPAQKETEDGVKKDLGSYHPTADSTIGHSLRSTELEILQDIEEKIGTSQVTASALELEPSWSIE